MPSPTTATSRTFPYTRRGGNVVQERPALGAMPRRRHGIGRWLVPLVDFASASLALALVAAVTGTKLFPAFPLASFLPLLAHAALRGHVSRPGSEMAHGTSRVAWWAIQALVAVLFAWSASLLMDLSSNAELALLGSFLLFDLSGRRAARLLCQRLRRPERWLVVGEESTAELLNRYEPLHAYATVVGTVAPGGEASSPALRSGALEAADCHGADRVVIACRNADDKRLLELVSAFKSTGLPVSMLPRPLDLLEAPAATPSEFGGVPMIDVEALPTRSATPYAGPDRRSERKTRISVVVPAKNEARNIGSVLRRLPPGLHEVILVDAGSDDETVVAAQHAYPKIRVVTQLGRGKGDAFRSGFAAVTGNLVVMLDADGSADPAEIPRFVQALEEGADFAKGSRYLRGGGSDDITLLRRLGNTFLSGTANLLHGTHFTDLCYGYNAFWTRCLPFISLDAPGFEVETLINLRIADAGMRITEVPSYEANRLSGQSNLKTFRDGFRVLLTIAREARRRQAIHPERHPIPAAGAPQAKTAAP